MKALFNRLVREENGQDLIEYALLAGFISLAAVAAIEAVGGKVNEVFGTVDTKLGTVPGVGGGGS